MSDRDRGQVTRTAAEVYEEFFVPALFAQWAPRVSAAAQVGPGDRALDVACGTGILARTMAQQAGATGAVTGLDANSGMLTVARQVAPTLDWREGQAESLPFGDGTVAAVGSQFGLMFFTDRQAALQEMARVLSPGRSLAVAVWDSLERSPGYLALAGLLGRLFGPEAAEALRAPFCLGDPVALQSLFDQAGLRGTRVQSEAGVAGFPSLEAWLTTEIKGWVLADTLDDDQFARLLSAAQAELLSFVGADGTVSFDAPAILVTYTKPN